MNSLYGKISVGFLLVQDFVAILILVLLAGIGAEKGFEFFDVFLTMIEGIGLFVLMLVLGRKFLPLIFDKISRSQELLFLTSLAWLFIVSAAVNKIGFSIEIGGFWPVWLSPIPPSILKFPAASNRFATFLF